MFSIRILDLRCNIHISLKIVNLLILCTQIQQTIHDGLREDYEEYLAEKASQAKSQSETSLSDHGNDDNADKFSIRSNKPDENGQFLNVSKKVMLDGLALW